ncbi:MAG: M20 family metallo-hydrolase [Treponema sp.]|nr:M20 family metallo-hydrolase [Treponema sp.]
MNDTELKKLFDYIESSTREMIALETLLTAHPALAPENGGDGEIEKCEVLLAWLAQNGLPAASRYDAPDSRVSSGKRPNAVVTIPGKSDDYAVWVMAHLDVVPVGEKSLWHTDPWSVVEKDGKLYGRGVEDNQQGLASGVFAALAYVKNNMLPEHTVKLLFMADEEVGSTYGMKYVLKAHEHLFRKEDVMVIPDGGDSRGETIEVAEKNIVWLRFHVIGKQTHGSRPDTGANACLAANELALLLHDMKTVFDKRDPLFTPDCSTFEPTMRLANVEGINIIPGDDVFCMDCRILPCYSIKEVLAEVDTRCAAIEKKYGVTVEYTTPQSEESPATPVDSPIVKKLSEAIKKAHGKTARTIGIGGGTVAAPLRVLGYNAAVWSTLDDMAHQPNEYCVIDNIVADAKTLAVLFSL